MLDSHRLLRSLTLWGVLIGAVALGGCGGPISQDGGTGRNADTNSSLPVSSVERPIDRNTITIASFNIQVLGLAKLEKTEVMDILARVIRRYDIVAVQELRSKQQVVIPQYLELINADGARYDAIVGPRLGRTSSKEQYVYLFDTDRIEVVQGSVYTVEDPDDQLHRPPLVARFRVRGPPPDQAFTFTLVNIHTDPDETDTELDALADVFASVQQNGTGEDDIILLGDLNVDPGNFGRLASLSNIGWAISDQTTNTRRSKLYDNIVFDTASTVEYTRESGVLDLMREFGLTMEQALNVSDHLPVWATFSVLEGGRGPIARTPSETAVQ